MPDSDSARALSHAPKQGISAAELARRANVEPPSIRHWESQGWVIRYSDRSINAEATLAMVDANRSTTNGGKPDRGSGAVKAAASAIPRQIPPAEADNDTSSPATRSDVPPVSSGINAIKAFRERIKAEKDLLDLRQKLGELVPVATAEKLFGAALASLVQNLENIPARAAPILAPMKNEFEIRTHLQDEIDRALHTIVIPDLTNAPPPEDTEDDEAEPETQEPTKPTTKPKKGVKKRAGDTRLA